jgi:ABC-2 type transport system permease protein
MLVIGISLTISVLNVFFRDIEHIIASLLVPWFFVTPIIYSFDMFPQLTERPWLRHLLEYGNIAAPFVISLQDVLYWGRAPSAVNLVYIFIVGGFILIAGALVFQRLQRDLAVEL